MAALDGKHVVLQAPANTRSEYYNYKHTFSTVLLAAVDGDYRFVYVSVGSAGRESDGGVFRRSDLAAAIRDDSLQLPPPKALPGTDTILPHVIVADEAFPLTTASCGRIPGVQRQDWGSKQRCLTTGSRALVTSWKMLSAFSHKPGGYIVGQ